MLHVTTEIGKPGKVERERRHFPHIDNHASFPTYKAQGRRYIPHGNGYDQTWAPHPQNIPIKYTENGPDWKSKLKYIEDPSDPKYPAAEIFENNWKAMRPFPYTYKRSNNEWLLDPGLTKVGLRCSFDGVHKATDTSDNEITHQMLFGKGRNVLTIDKRNGIPFATEGDKTYQAVEYSPDFHKRGSTRPCPQFGTVRDNFRENERKKSREEDISNVKELDGWKPATPLHLTLPQEETKK